MIKITCFSGSERNVKNGKVQQYSFVELASIFSKPEQGRKHDGYFVRGELSPLHRKNENLKSSELLILDGDASTDNPISAPPPKDVHNHLMQRNISHFIYTSHSHGIDRNKYRVVILCALPAMNYLKPTALKITKELNNAGIKFQYVKEMGVWSQAWFIPKRDDPDDGLFEHYYHDGDRYISSCTFESESTIDRENESSTIATPIHERIKQIQTGEVFHDNLISLSWGYLRDGVHPTAVVATLEGIMQGCKVQDERWQGRFNDIPRIVQEAIPKQDDNVDLDNINIDNDFDEEIPWPPGLLGELANDAYNMQIHPYREVALVSALGLVAGIAGRKYNVSNTGLNLYITLIMRTGMGKDSINEFIESTLINLNETGNAFSFLGTGRFTGPSAVFNDLRSARSQVCVFTEAGLLLRSRVGDVDGLTRAFLSLYTVSGKDRVSKKETFTSTDNSIAPLRAVALTIVNEATPETLLKAFDDSGSLENGLLPRQSIIRVSRGKTYPQEPNRKLNPKCQERLLEIIKKCANVQATEDPEAITMTYHDSIVSDIGVHARGLVDLYNKFIESDTTKAIMASRLHIKALKLAAIASVINHSDTVIKSEEWEWAKKFTQYEYNGVDNFFQGSKSSKDLHSLAKHVLGKSIIKVMRNEYKTAKRQMDKKYRDEGIISLYVLGQILKNNSELANISDDPQHRSNPKSGFEKVMDYAIKQSFLVRTEDPYSKKNNLFKITALFKELML